MFRASARLNGFARQLSLVLSELQRHNLTPEILKYLASQVQDRLTTMQAATLSFRPARSYANNWGNDIKVEIPDTGISFGEAYRYLKSWLGGETHVGGEVIRTDNGISFTTRVGGGDGPVFRVRHLPCTRVEPGTPFHNPYGVWLLEETDEEFVPQEEEPEN